ncbi:MAG: ZIP family metal transporter [Candidatus Bathyarchaeia archaeon]
METLNRAARLPSRRSDGKLDSLLYALLAVTAVSVLSLIGVFAISLDEKMLDRILLHLIGFSAGSILGAAYFDLLPEALELLEGSGGFVYLTFGFVGFFILERFIYWYHGHAHESEIGKRTVVKRYVYLNLLGDGIHNFIDGTIIAATFLLDVGLGVVSTFAVIFHEIPQEIGDFGVLLFGGFTRGRALLFNFLSALTAVAGALFSALFSVYMEGFVGYLIAFAAGGFIYISASELLPEIQQERDFKKSLAQFVTFLLGLALIWVLGATMPA